MDHRKAVRASDRHGCARAALLVLAVGLLAFAHLGGGCPPPRRSVDDVQADVSEKETRKNQIEDELESYGGRYDKDEGRWHIDFMGFMTRRDTREHIQNLRDEWHNLDSEIHNLNNELSRAQERAAQHVVDRSHDATTGTTGVPAHIGAPTTPHVDH